MRVLVCAPHFFGRSEGSNPEIMGSASSSADERASTVNRAIRSWSSLFLQRVYIGTTGQTRAGTGFIVNDNANAIKNRLHGDIYLVTSGQNHLFERVSSGFFPIGLHLEDNLHI